MTNEQEYAERKREEARKFYAGWIAALADRDGDGATSPSVGGPRITKQDGRFYVDPAQRIWRDGIPEGLVPVSQEAAVSIAAEYDLALHGII